jgi:CheY-like chemotaxis protein
MGNEAIHVLAVDDDQIILRSIARQLRSAGFELDIESNPENAMPRIRVTHYDVVLCDIKMKPLNGLEVLDLIRAEFPDLPVIIVSAFVDDQTVESARKLGCKEFLFKPVKKALLIEAVIRAADGSVS